MILDAVWSILPHGSAGAGDESLRREREMDVNQLNGWSVRHFEVGA